VALNIKDKETEALVSKIAALTGETEAEAVRQAATERLGRLTGERAAAGEGPMEALRRERFGDRRQLDYDPKASAENFQYWRETEIWPLIPAESRGKPPLSKAEREELLGYGPGGV